MASSSAMINAALFLQICARVAPSSASCATICSKMIVATKADEYDDQRRASRCIGRSAALAHRYAAPLGSRLAAKLKCSHVSVSGLDGTGQPRAVVLLASSMVDARLKERSAGSNAVAAPHRQTPGPPPCRAADRLTPAISTCGSISPSSACAPSTRPTLTTGSAMLSRTARWQRASPSGNRQAQWRAGQGRRQGPAPWASPLIGPRAARWRRPSCRRPSVTKSARRSGCGASSWNCGRSSRSGASKQRGKGPSGRYVGWLADCGPRPSARGLSVKKSSNARRR